MLVSVTKPAVSQEMKLQIIVGDSVYNNEPLYGSYNELLEICKKEKSRLLIQGYAAVSFDSLQQNDSILNAYFFLGNRYSFSNIKIPGMTNREKRKAGLRLGRIKGKNFSTERLKNIYKKINTYYGNIGYPFAEIIPEIKINDQKETEVLLKIEKHRLVRFNEVFIKGDLKSSKKYVVNSLQISKGNIYSEKTVKNLSSKILEIRFIKEIRPPQLEFYDNKADVYLYLKNHKTNSFNGLVGLIPDSLNDYKLTVTGDLQLELYDSFRKGEFVSVQWKRNAKQAQMLKAEIMYPYPFGVPFELSSNFLFDKTDSTFLNLNYRVGANYIFSDNSRLIFLFNQTKSVVLGNENNIRLNDTKLSVFELGYARKQLDYLFNPSSGYSFSALFGTGNRKFNDQTENVLTADISVELFLNAYKRFVVKFGAKHKNLMLSGNLFENELYKFGGYKTMRGFDEDNFKASQYSVFSVELKYLYEKNAAAYLFAEFGNFKDYDDNSRFVWSFGPGINFDTKAGIFSFNYALGEEWGNTLLFSNSKIHIGYVNRF